MQLLSVTYPYLNWDPLGLFSTLGAEQVIYTGKLMFKKQPSAGEREHTLDSSPSGQGNWDMLYIAFQMSLGYWAPVAHSTNWLILYPGLVICAALSSPRFYFINSSQPVHPRLLLCSIPVPSLCCALKTLHRQWARLVIGFT